MEYQKHIVFDFDGVCATYDGWKGPDVFGDPIEATAVLVKHLQEKGLACILWTTRKDTPALRKWLGTNGFNFDSVNSCDHNPPDTSMKPIAELYIDDRGLRFDPKKPYLSCERVLQTLDLK